MDGFRYDLTPEYEIFFWEMLVLTVLEVFALAAELGIRFDDYKWDKSFNQRVSRPPSFTIGHLHSELALRSFLDVDADVREKGFHTLLYISHGLLKVKDAPFGHIILNSLVRVEWHHREQTEAVKQIKEKRYQKVMGYQCSQCNTRSKDMKKCARCDSAYYCNRACQVKHYPLHKKVCKPPETTASSSVPSPQ